MPLGRPGTASLTPGTLYFNGADESTLYRDGAHDKLQELLEINDTHRP